MMRADADYDGDEDFDVGGEGQPHLKQVLQLLRPVLTCWNSMYYTIKRALAEGFASDVFKFRASPQW